jgi:hypothetical protein
MILILVGCTSRECEHINVKFPRLESVDVNSSIDIPTYKIEKQKIKIADENIIMSIETFKKIKEGDAMKVKYLLKKLKVFIFGLKVMNEQVEKFNKEFVDGQDRSD